MPPYNRSITPALLLGVLVLASVAVGEECKRYDPIRMCPIMQTVYLEDYTCGIKGTQPPAEPITGTDKCECDDHTADNSPIGYYDAPCQDHKHTRFYFWKDPAAKHCVSTMPPLPIHGIPCHMVCKQGQYRDIHKHRCADCEKGTYAVGGGDRYNRWSRKDGWPNEFSLKCNQAYSTECAGWQLNGDYIHSGDNSVEDGASESTSSVLRLVRNLLRPGHISFTYRVEAEPDDGLLFYINGDLVMPRESRKLDWTTVKFDLEKPGYYHFAWIYRKNEQNSYGRDRVEISSIEVLGTRWAENECEKCPLGRFANVKQAHSCQPCPPGTYADEEGLAECKKCSDNQYSFQGAHQCVDRKPCGKDDMQARFTFCADNQRTKFWEWLEPHLCSEQLQGALSLPKNETVACAPCPPGKPQREGFHCQTCPTGEFSPGAMIPCAKCAPGHAAMKSKYYQRWDEALPEMVTPCVEFPTCGSAWRLMDTYIDSGISTTSDWTEFDLNLDFYTTGSVTFNFSLECDPNIDYGGACEFDFQIDEFYMDSYDDSTTYGQTVEKTYGDIEPGPHKLRWLFKKKSFGDDLAKVQIYNIEVRGVKDGGAGECRLCPAGTRVSDDATECLRCPTGSISKAGEDKCQLCPANTFQPLEGGTECIPCGAGTTSSEGAQECQHTCSFKTTLASGSEALYNLTMLRSPYKMFGPVIDASVNITKDEAKYHYYLNICPDEENNSTYCYDNIGRPMYTACQVQPDSDWDPAVDIGHLVNFEPYKEDPGNGLVVRYTRGTAGCTHRNGQGSKPAPPIERTTVITLQCDPDAGIGHPELVEHGEDPKCQYNFVWTSRHACRICSEDDLVLVEGDCIDGVSTKEYKPKAGARCVGGASAQESVATACERHIKVGYVMALVLCGLVIIFCGGPLLAMYIKNRRLYSQYSRLVGDGTEMNVIEGESDDEVLG